MGISSIHNKPIVFIGEYIDNVRHFLEDQYLTILEPKILWIDCHVIPIIEVVPKLKNYQELKSSIFFLQPSTIEVFENLLNSGELFSTKNQGFSTIIINIPEYCTIQNEGQILILELSKNMKIFLFMKEQIFPKSSVIVACKEELL
ncbi:MAG: hypothetical protein ACFFAU_00325 [Candidatus Hodarchaeota archaeon]